MNAIKKDRYIIYAIFIIFLSAAIIYKTCINNNYKKALIDSTVVIGEIERFEYSKGATTVDVKFNYNEKIMHGSFDTYDLDSLKIKTKIKLRISKKYPEKYIELISVENK